MKTVLIVDEEKRMIEAILNNVYPENIPFEYETVTSIDSAIEEMKRREFRLVLTDEFCAAPKAGDNVDDLLFSGEVLRLLEFCTDNCPRARVCIVSLVTITRDEDELYRSYPCVVEVVGERYTTSKERRLRRAIDRALAGVVAERP